MERQAVYNKKKRLVYGVSLLLNISGCVFFFLEVVQNPIDEQYWQMLGDLEGKFQSCKDSCRAGMAVAAFVMMSASSWLNYIHDNHENQFFSQIPVQGSISVFHGNPCTLTLVADFFAKLN